MKVKIRHSYYLDSDDELLITAECVGVCEREEPDLVESVRRIGDELSEVDLFVLVERVYNELHHAVNLRLENVFLRAFLELLHLSDAQTIQLDCFLLSEILMEYVYCAN